MIKQVIDVKNSDFGKIKKEANKFEIKKTDIDKVAKAIFLQKNCFSTERNKVNEKLEIFYEKNKGKLSAINTACNMIKNTWFGLIIDVFIRFVVRQNLRSIEQSMCYDQASEILKSSTNPKKISDKATEALKKNKQNQENLKNKCLIEKKSKTSEKETKKNETSNNIKINIENKNSETKLRLEESETTIDKKNNQSSTIKDELITSFMNENANLDVKTKLKTVLDIQELGYEQVLKLKHAIGITKCTFEKINNALIEINEKPAEINDKESNGLYYDENNEQFIDSIKKEMNKSDSKIEKIISTNFSRDNSHVIDENEK